jgi:hypothetical protein
MNSFWNGFEKKAASVAGRVSQAAGLVAGGGTAAGIWKATRHGLDNPNATGIPKALAGVVRKVGKKHPTLAALTPFGMSAAGGGVAEEIARRGARALQKHLKSRTSRIGDFLKGFKKSYKNFLKKIEKARKSK